MISNKTNSLLDSSIGQVFTPFYVARFIVKMAMNHIKSNDIKALEPSAGKGVFIECLIDIGLKDITAYEIDSNMGNYLSSKYPDVKLLNENFLSASEEDKYDLIVGNPPYLGQNYNSALFQEYREKYPLCERFFTGNMDLFYYFIHQSISKLKPGGIISFITTNYWITKSKKTGIKFLKPHLLDECYILEYIDLSKLTIFKNALGQKNCIFILQKKTNTEKINQTDKTINITTINIENNKKGTDRNKTKKIFELLLEKSDSPKIIRYVSATTNKELNPEGSWFLLNPKSVAEVVNKIENKCVKDNRVVRLKDYFAIRNGIIFIKDDIFILYLNKNMKIKENDTYVKIYSDFVKVPKQEEYILKRIYKSKSISPYGHIKDKDISLCIFFNKNEFKSSSSKSRNRLLERKYPVLSSYLKQFEQELRNILINARENPDDFYFPRRGAFIRNNKHKDLINLEPLYDSSPKIFFKFVSSENQFGYSTNSYYATSDTYFVWPRISEINEYLPFYLAYFNSKLFKFLFKAKNISVKRSKTKLENLLPIPDFQLLKEKKEYSIIQLILALSRWLTGCYQDKFLIEYEEALEKQELKSMISLHWKNTKQDLKTTLQAKNIDLIIDFIDDLIFHLFDIEESKIDFLITKYY
ncbi:MAG: Eco57I restriction-modification methylase domain-containing protein [Promethearchaeota archaeon]